MVQTMIELASGIKVRDRVLRESRVRGSFETRGEIAWFIGFGIFTLIISLGFFWEGTRASFSSLSGDQYNILTIAAKKDYPHLLQGDMVVGDPKSVDYYIPAFVDMVRFLSLPDHNYLRGLNILLLLTSMLYLWGWWMLFSLWGDRWIAALSAFLVRGVMWPPGNELWGIAGLWTMLPRTLYLALLPWVLWAWFRARRSRRGWLSACLLCGLIVNIHPISGICVVVALVVAEFVWTVVESRNLKAAISRCFLGFVLMLIGMTPFIWTYLFRLGSTTGINPVEFYQAAQMRIDPIFWSPWLYIKLWLRPKWLTLILLPWICCILVPRRVLGAHKNTVLALGAFSLGCIMTSLLPFLMEGILNNLGYQARFAFQLVRTCKYIIVPSLILAVLLCALTSQKLARHFRYGRAVVVGVSCLVVLLTLFSRYTVFDRVPVLGDDVSRFLWPAWGKPESFKVEEGQIVHKNIDGVLRWIRGNTAEDAKFVGPRQIRAGSLRPVIHDFAGAGMLIEGSPKALVEAARRERELVKAEAQGPFQESQLYVTWGADYWVTQVFVPDLRLVYSDSGWFVYHLKNDRQPSRSISLN